MIISEFEQGTDEWMAERTGIPSASNFSKIFTTAGKPSATATTYMNELVAEWVLGEKEQIKVNEWMTRGLELEAEARKAYSFVNEVDVLEVGFCFKDEDKLVGCSPDGLVGTNGILEIKCPKASTHIGYILGGKLPSTYFQQVHGQLWVTGRDDCDFISYYPGLPNFEIRVEREQKNMGMIDSHLAKFIDEMLDRRERIKSL